jgi:hypothetical protein
MRTAVGFVGLLVATSMLWAADTPKPVVVRPNGTGKLTLGQTAHLAYPYDSETTPSLRRLVIDKKFVVGLKEVHTGPADKGENNVIFTPKSTGTIKIVLEAFIGPRENTVYERYNYTLQVKKKDDE